MFVCVQDPTTVHRAGKAKGLKEYAEYLVGTTMLYATGVVRYTVLYEGTYS